MNASQSSRATKVLACTADASQHQKHFAAQLRARVIDRGEPFALAQADTPHEIFHAMDIPLVSNQWWSAYISAKRLAGQYFRVLDAQGFPANRCRYCSLGLGCTLAADEAQAPWGGLPRPTVMVARLTCECIEHVFSQWAAALGTEFFAMEAPAWQDKRPDWFKLSKEHWDEVYGPQRIQLLVEEMRALIELLERKTGRHFDPKRLEALMLRINEQETHIARAADLIAAARPCPVSIVEQMPNTMIPQWHRGSDWAVAHARRFQEEVAQRVAAGLGAAAQEKVRLMWIGAGLWHDTSFYQALEERWGAVFVWSMYMPFAEPQYIRALHGRPMEALASRICSMNEVLHLPPWMNSWMVSEAQRFGIDAAVMLVPPDNRLSQSGTRLTELALREAGVPVLRLGADMVDEQNWSHESMARLMEEFLREHSLI